MNITVFGLQFAVELERDELMGAPWEEHDGHGPVSEWTTRERADGEFVLAGDGSYHHRFYNYRAALEIAKRDGWGTESDEGLDAEQKAMKAVMADYNHLRDWCNDVWHWAEIVVTLLDEAGNKTNEFDTLGGVESNDIEYITSEATSMAEGIVNRLIDEYQDAA